MPIDMTTVAAQAKDTAKHFVERHPKLVKNNRVFHRIQHQRAYRNIAMRPELTERKDLLQRLDQDGIVVVEDYVSKPDAARILAATESTLAKSRAGDLPDRTFTLQPDIVVRVADVEEVVPETAEFFDDPVIASVMRAYLSADIASYRHELEYRFGVSAAAQADLWHFDNWRPIVKAFLYLDDVTEDNAPFTYMPRSHKPAPWRVPYEISYDTNGTGGRFGHFFPQEIRALREELGWQERVCTGPAGTLILADFRGLHRGTPLRDGRRVLLNNTFDLMN